jgi:hypothetical protein
LLSWDTYFPGILAFLGHLLSWDTYFPGILAFLGHLLSWDTCFPRPQANAKWKAEPTISPIKNQPACDLPALITDENKPSALWNLISLSSLVYLLFSIIFNSYTISIRAELTTKPRPSLQKPRF